MSAELVVEADVQSIVVAPFLLGSTFCAISTSCVSAGLLVLAVFVQKWLLRSC